MEQRRCARTAGPDGVDGGDRVTGAAGPAGPPGFPLTARWTGLSAGPHTVKLICINDGGTPAIGPNPTITAIGTGG